MIKWPPRTVVFHYLMQNCRVAHIANKIATAAIEAGTELFCPNFTFQIGWNGRGDGRLPCTAQLHGGHRGAQVGQRRHKH